MKVTMPAASSRVNGFEHHVSELSKSTTWPKNTRAGYAVCLLLNTMRLGKKPAVSIGVPQTSCSKPL